MNSLPPCQPIPPHGLDRLRRILMRKVWSDACISVLIDMGVYDPDASLQNLEARYLASGSFAKAVRSLADLKAQAAGFDCFDPKCLRGRR